MADSVSKRCTKCGEVKPVGDFGLLASSPDDRRSRCRACQNHPPVEHDGREPGEDNSLRQYHRNYYLRNREKLREQQRLQYANMSTEEKRSRSRRYYLRSVYGLTPEDWTAMWEAQGGCCYLCGDGLIIDDAALDHDHSCCPGKRPCGRCIRGLAHTPCNLTIGYVGDSPAQLRRMADALEAAQEAAGSRRTEVG